MAVVLLDEDISSVRLDYFGSTCTAGRQKACFNIILLFLLFLLTVHQYIDLVRSMYV
jgi:hypothetical protein